MAYPHHGSVDAPRGMPDFALRLTRADTLRYGGMLAADLVALTAAFAAAALVAIAINAWVFEQAYLEFITNNAAYRLAHFAPLGALLILRFHIAGHYRFRLPFWTELKDILVSCAMALLVDGFLMFALKQDFSRLWLTLCWIMTVLLVPVGRWLGRAALDACGLWRLPVIVIGSGDDARDASHALASERNLGYDVIDVVPFTQVTGQDGRYWTQLCREKDARLIVLALSGTDMLRHNTLLADLVRERLPFAVIPPLRGLPILGFDQLYFLGYDVMMMLARNNLAQPLSRGVKLVFDVTLSAVLTVALLPIFLVLALLVARDGGPVFYRHVRVGRTGRPFGCLKFRTMVPDADRMLADHLARNPAAQAEWKRFYKLRDDPRVTRIGRFLRATSLDELPQLLNVLRGDMSLVGPRPVTPEELEFYGRDVVFYLETRPGMTGLWQVRGRSEASYEMRVIYDTWYVKNWSLWHDIVILAKTVPVVLRRIGAS